MEQENNLLNKLNFIFNENLLFASYIPNDINNVDLSKSNDNFKEDFLSLTLEQREVVIFTIATEIALINKNKNFNSTYKALNDIEEKFIINIQNLIKGFILDKKFLLKYKKFLENNEELKNKIQTRGFCFMNNQFLPEEYYNSLDKIFLYEEKEYHKIKEGKNFFYRITDFNTNKDERIIIFNEGIVQKILILNYQNQNLFLFKKNANKNFELFIQNNINFEFSFPKNDQEFENFENFLLQNNIALKKETLPIDYNKRLKEILEFLIFRNGKKPEDEDLYGDFKNIEDFENFFKILQTNIQSLMKKYLLKY